MHDSVGDGAEEAMRQPAAAVCGQGNQIGAKALCRIQNGVDHRLLSDFDRRFKSGLLQARRDLVQVTLCFKSNGFLFLAHNRSEYWIGNGVCAARGIYRYRILHDAEQHDLRAAACGQCANVRQDRLGEFRAVEG